MIGIVVFLSEKRCGFGDGCSLPGDLHGPGRAGYGPGWEEGPAHFVRYVSIGECARKPLSSVKYSES